MKALLSGRKTLPILKESLACPHMAWKTALPVPEESPFRPQEPFSLDPEDDLHGEGDEAEPVCHVRDQAIHNKTFKNIIIACVYSL
jgi:hypothetical protein